MQPIDTKTVEHNGFSAEIKAYHDEHMGEPWKEHDGHGIVSEWTTRDKAPGELVLNTDRRSFRYYDFKGTLQIARKDGWGLSQEEIGKLSARLGHTATQREITAESVRRDYEHLRAWCNDEWFWTGYTTTITAPDGQTRDGDSCWGFDDLAYMLEEATGNAVYSIEQWQKEMTETAIAECCP